MSTAQTIDLTHAAPEHQGMLFDLADVEGFGALSRRERMFCEGIVLGLSQRQAARAAGVQGDDAAVDVIACRLAKKPEVRRFLGQCWTRSGANIAQTLMQATRIQQRAWHDYETATNRDARAAAMKEWREASTLVASIHGKLSLRVDGQIDHRHSGAIGVVTVPKSALEDFAKMHREVVVSRLNEVKEGAA
jgi:hypothetical protein